MTTAEAQTRNDLYDELFNATQAVPEIYGPFEKGNPESQQHLVAVIERMQHLSDAEWRDLSPEAQHWYNAAVNAHNDGRAIKAP